MPVLSYKMGPGTLSFGAGAQVASAQVTKCKVSASESVKKVDAIPTLSGDELPAEETATLEWKLDATVIQSLLAAGFVSYSWVNAGDEVSFIFDPSTAEDRRVTGTVRVVPVDIGGDVSARNTSDLTWSIIGTPALGDIP